MCRVGGRGFRAAKAEVLTPLADRMDRAAAWLKKIIPTKQVDRRAAAQSQDLSRSLARRYTRPMTYRVRLIEDEEGGFAAICPELPGCVSQGETEAEAMENVTEAIRLYLAVREELLAQQGGTLREVELKRVA